MTITIWQLAKVVRRMRVAEDQYWTHRKGYTRKVARRLQVLVDKMLASIIWGSPEPEGIDEEINGPPIEIPEYNPNDIDTM